MLADSGLWHCCQYEKMLVNYTHHAVRASSSHMPTHLFIASTHPFTHDNQEYCACNVLFSLSLSLHPQHSNTLGQIVCHSPNLPNWTCHKLITQPSSSSSWLLSLPAMSPMPRVPLFRGMLMSGERNACVTACTSSEYEECGACTIVAASGQRRRPQRRHSLQSCEHVVKRSRRARARTNRTRNARTAPNCTTHVCV